MVLRMMLTEKASIPLKGLLNGLLQGVPKNRLSAEQALLRIEGEATRQWNNFNRRSAISLKCVND
jgi:hypothetical protein